MHEKLRQQTAEANLLLCQIDFGSVSLFDRTAGVIVVKPKEIAAVEADKDNMLVALPDGQILFGQGTLPAEFAMYAAIFENSEARAIASGYPECATAFAQAGRQIKPYGMLHAKYFGGPIPCTRQLNPSEIEGDYAANLGALIAQTASECDNFITKIGCMLIHDGGTVAMADSPVYAAERMIAMEKIAKIAMHTEVLQRIGNAGGTRMQEDLLRRCFDQ